MQKRFHPSLPMKQSTAETNKSVCPAYNEISVREETMSEYCFRRRFHEDISYEKAAVGLLYAGIFVWRPAMKSQV